jgi:hypothetical protein
MGNRAVITLDQEPTDDSIGIYLHWNGGPESVLAFAEAAKQFGVRTSDVSYGTARLAQIIGNYFGGTLSLGVGTLATLDTGNGNNGTIKISLTTDEVILHQSEDGEAPWHRIDSEKIRKEHEYWNPKDGETSILEDVIATNKKVFSESE